MNPYSLIKSFQDKALLVEYSELLSNKEILIQHNNELKSFSKSKFEAYSVRTFVKGAFGFSSTSNPKELPRIFKESYNLALNASRNKLHKSEFKELDYSVDNVKSSVKEDPFTMSDEEKLSFVSNVNKIYSSKEIKDIESSTSFTKRISTYANSRGGRIVQNDNYTGFSSVIVGGENLETASVRKYAKLGFELFKKFDVNKALLEVEEKLIRLIRAPYAKPGVYDLVLDPDIAGIFFHEALGHALEADTIREKSTCIALSDKVGPDFLTLVDDPTIPDKWGSFAYDDEGMKSKHSTLKKEGVVVNFINDYSSYLDVPGLVKTSNGRAETPHSIPIPRMSNTVVKKGSMAKDELISHVKDGLLVAGFAGGAVEPLTRVFSFKAPEAFVIKDGKIEGSIKGVTLSGDLKTLLMNITNIGKETLDGLTGGFCGKKGQHIPVAQDVPYMSVRGVSVGN